MEDTVAPVSISGCERRKQRLEGITVVLSSYPMGSEFVCAVDDCETGMLIARGHGRTRGEAEKLAVSMARSRLRTRRRLGDTLVELRTRVAALDRRLSEPPPAED